MNKPTLFVIQPSQVIGSCGNRFLGKSDGNQYTQEALERQAAHAVALQTVNN
jgi:hypothetical protein